MPFVDLPPWPASLQRAPCVALGWNRPVAGNWAGHLGPIAAGVSPGRGFPARRGEISATACVLDDNPSLLEITIIHTPAPEEEGKRLRLLFDSVDVNGVVVQRLTTYGTEYPFEISLKSRNFFTFVVNAGDRVPDWFSVSEVLVDIAMTYQGDQQDPSRVVYRTNTLYNKGPAPPPVSISIIGDNTMRIRFFGVPGSRCACFSECFPATGLEIICPEVDYEVDVSITTDSISPSLFDFLLTDAGGNKSSISISSMEPVVPLSPHVVIKSPKPSRRIILGVPLLSTGFNDLSPYVREFQIQKYVGSENNLSIFRDWQRTSPGNKSEKTSINLSDNVVYDTDIVSNVVHGYRVRYRGESGDVSKWSAWSSILPRKFTENINIDDGVYI